MYVHEGILIHTGPIRTKVNTDFLYDSDLNLLGVGETNVSHGKPVEVRRQLLEPAVSYHMGSRD